MNSSEDMLASTDITPAANTLDEAEASGGAVIGVGGEGGEGVLSGREGGSALETSTRAGGEGKSVRDGGENWRKSESTSLDRYGNTFGRDARYTSWFTLQDLEAGAPKSSKNAQKY